MKNEMIKLADYRKIFDLITDWADSNEREIYADFDVDNGKAYLSLNSENYMAMIDEDAVSEIEKLFLNGAKLVDSGEDIRVYELGDLPYKFNVTTIELVKYATDNGFVFNDTDLFFDCELLIDFIKDNLGFTIKANEDGEVIIA